MHAERLHRACVPSLVLIAQAVFLLVHKQTDKETDRQTDTTKRPTHAGGYTAGLVNNIFNKKLKSLSYLVYPVQTITRA